MLLFPLALMAEEDALTTPPAQIVMPKPVKPPQSENAILRVSLPETQSAGLEKYPASIDPASLVSKPPASEPGVVPTPPPTTPTETHPESKTAENVPAEICGDAVFDTLGTGARIRISVFGHPDLSRNAEIGPKGSITMPLIGEVHAEGETPASLAATIAKKLNDGFLVEPGVDVEIVQYPPFYMTGLIAAPGLYDYKPRITVRQAVALAGGFSIRARTSSVRILRRKPGNPLEQLDIIGELDSPVLPGDTIEVLRRWF